MLAFLYWDPSPYVFSFSLPFLHRPILWYGVLFALGFFVGYFIFKRLLFAYLCTRPYVSKTDVISAASIAQVVRSRQEVKQYILSFQKKELSKELSDFIERAPLSDFSLVSSKQKKVYSHLLANEKRRVFCRMYLEALFSDALLSLSKLCATLSEKVSFASILGAIVGARLGDLLFYQNFSDIVKDPLMVIRIWEGGLASHGGAVGVIVALYFITKKEAFKSLDLSLLRLLDIVSIPAMFAGAMIRLGNFINQEILGRITYVPWAVVFCHPADHSKIAPRHPVQLYEMISYLGIFLFLSLKWKKYFRLKVAGRVFGQMLMYVFSMRFVLEFFKEEQSVYLGHDSLVTMGQILSIPFVILGAFLFFRKKALRP